MILVGIDFSADRNSVMTVLPVFLLFLSKYFHDVFFHIFKVKIQGKSHQNSPRSCKTCPMNKLRLCFNKSEEVIGCLDSSYFHLRSLVTVPL